MSDRMARRGWIWILGMGVALAVAPGCTPQNPNATGIEKPIVTDDAPMTSEEAAAQSEPEPIQYKTRRPR